MTLDKKAVLKQYFGHSSFRDGQERVVDAILQERDALCVMPTGAGKSVCYQVPALMFEGITVVVSPLISLMKDQVNALTQNGIKAAYLNSSLTYAQYLKVIENIRHGIYKIIYVAPERLAVPDFLAVCEDIKVDLLAIDEAHCISQWGQDFRPSYLKITDFVNSLRYRPIVAAFTATATTEVKDDIEYSLKLRNPFRITTGFDRPNLRFEVIRPKQKFEELLRVLKTHTDDSGIIYCSTRKNVEEVTEKLKEAGFSATMYHAGLDDDTRKQNQEDFVYDRKNIIVATNAFGMGIDKSNVSYVIHYNMPKDIESYYQEAGRAGRDGEKAECILLYNPGDVHTNQFLIEHSEPNPDLTEKQQNTLKERDYNRLKQMTFYSTSNTCLRSFILNYFGEKSSNYCGNCSNCIAKFIDLDITVDAQKIFSCIRRTGCRFGKQMICDILRGSKNEKIMRMGLDSQTTYGLMKEYKASQVREIIDHLEFEGYIESVGSKYPRLVTTFKSNSVLFGSETVFMKQAKPEETPPIKIEKAKPTEKADPVLYEKLKALRKQIADTKGIPAYIVFSDATLVDMCKKRPQTLDEMLEVSGVGNVKLKLYGERFLNVLSSEESFDDEKIEEKMPEVQKRVRFSPTAAQLANFRYSDEPIALSELHHRLDELVDHRKMRYIARSRIPVWLVLTGFLNPARLTERRYAGAPTDAGLSIGLFMKTYTDEYGERNVLMFNREAQEFIIDHLSVIKKDTVKYKEDKADE